MTPERNDEGRAAEIEDRLGKATPGPWVVTGYKGQTVRTNEKSDTILPLPVAQFAARENADLIANAPSDLRWLLDALAEAKNDAATWRRYGEDCAHAITTSPAMQDLATAESSLASVTTERDRLREALACDCGAMGDVHRDFQTRPHTEWCAATTAATPRDEP